MTKKKARFFSQPKNLSEKIEQFIFARDEYIKQGRQFVSLDETSFGRNSKSAFGYCRKGTPLRIVKNSSRPNVNISSLVVISNSTIIKHQEIKGSYNSEKCACFIESLNCSKGTVILLDNVSFHHSKIVSNVASAKEYTLLFTPPYSPWFNPIEGIFSIVKRHFYKGNSIENSFDIVTSNHCKAFFQESFSLKN